MLSPTAPLLLLLLLLTFASSHARIIAPAPDSTIPFIPDMYSPMPVNVFSHSRARSPLWVRFDAAGVPDGEVALLLLWSRWCLRGEKRIHTRTRITTTCCISLPAVNRTLVRRAK